MGDNYFEIPVEDNLKFIANRKTGKWVLSENFKEKYKEYLDKEPINGKFVGTSMVVLNISRICNFNCVYCQVGDLKNNFQRMSEEIGEKAIDRIFELPEQSRQVVFHGSEPMTNFNLIKELVDYSKGKGKIRFCMQSNGSLFDKEKLEYLIKEEVGIGISFDGLEQHQNFSRPYLNGNPSYHKVCNNLKEIKEIQKGLSVITVVSKNNVNYLEEITVDFENKGLSSVTFSPLFSSIKSKDYCPEQKDLIYNMEKIFDRYLNKLINKEKTIRILNFRNFTRTIFKEKNTDNCVKCSGNNVQPIIGIDINGDIYPCDFFWGREEYKIGNISGMSLFESFNSSKNFRVYRSLGNLPGCSVCDWQRFCGADCPGSSVLSDNGIASKSYYCDYNKSMFKYIVKKISLIHKNNLLEQIIN